MTFWRELKQVTGFTKAGFTKVFSRWPALSHYILLESEVSVLVINGIKYINTPFADDFNRSHYHKQKNTHMNVSCLKHLPGPKPWIAHSSLWNVSPFQLLQWQTHPYRSPRDDVTSHLHTLTTNHKKFHISDYTIIKTAQNTTLSTRPWQGYISHRIFALRDSSTCSDNHLYT